MRLPLFKVSAPDGGEVAICPMPGSAQGLSEDVDRIRDAGITLVLAITTPSERPPALENALETRCIAFRSLPISDFGAPGPATHAAWLKAAQLAHRILDEGGQVLAHCLGGQGRSGMAAMRLLVERGMAPLDALCALRLVRPGAVETEAQQDWASLPAETIILDCASSSVSWDDLHRLLSRAFVNQHERIDPPSSLLRLTPDDLRRKAAAEKLWTASRGARLAGCLFTKRLRDTVYLSKMAVWPGLQNLGIGRKMIDYVAADAKSHGIRALELESRVQLTETHAAFKAYGFEEIGRTVHPGFDAPTSIRFRKTL